MIVEDDIETINGIMAGVSWDHLQFDSVRWASLVEVAMEKYREEPADIVLVFVKKPMVIYEANGGDQYTHGDNGTNAVSFAQQVSDDGSKTERLPYESQ